jgi:hypothetical protein
MSRDPEIRDRSDGSKVRAHLDRFRWACKSSSRVPAANRGDRRESAPVRGTWSPGGSERPNIAVRSAAGALSEAVSLRGVLLREAGERDRPRSRARQAATGVLGGAPVASGPSTWTGSLSNAPLRREVDLHPDRGHDRVQRGERRIGRAAFDVRNVRLVDAGDLGDLLLSQVSCAPRLGDLATQAKVRAEGLELLDGPRPFGLLLSLVLSIC